MNPGPKIISLAGPSGGGKSTVADCLAQRLEKPPSPVLDIDWFYCDLANLPESERRLVNFDHPASIDWQLFESVLRGLAKGETMPCPVYDFTRHTRTGGIRLFKPGSYLIVEGIFALFPAARKLAQTRVFVEAPAPVCLSRIMKRDLQERAWNQQDVIRRFKEQVWPMYLEHVLPTKEFAQVVIDGTAPVADSANRVVQLFE